MFCEIRLVMVVENRWHYQQFLMFVLGSIVVLLHEGLTYCYLHWQHRPWNACTVSRINWFFLCIRASNTLLKFDEWLLEETNIARWFKLWRIVPLPQMPIKIPNNYLWHLLDKWPTLQMLSIRRKPTTFGSLRSRTTFTLHFGKGLVMVSTATGMLLACRHFRLLRWL